MFHDSFEDCPQGVLIQFHTDCSVLNLQRLKAKSRITEILLRDLLFADDCALFSHNLEDVQFIFNSFVQSAHRYGLKISLKKTKAILQPRPECAYTVPHITIDDMPLKVVDKFCYLGGVLSQNAMIDDKVTSRHCKACVSFGRLTHHLWHERGVRLDTKISVYRVVIQSTLLYGCKSWTPYHRQIKCLDQFHM